MKILITGFDPFGEDKINPAIEAVKRLPDKIENVSIIKIEIPTIFNQCAEVVHKAILNNKPDYVVNIGQAGGRFGLTPERIAININDGRIKDNAGYQPLNTPIQDDGQTAYFTQLPVKAIARSIRSVGLPSYVSTTAGTYVCNHIMYQVQYMIDKEFHNLKAGFIHIPFLPEQVINRPNTPSLSLTNDVKGLRAAIRTIIEFDDKDDLPTVEGSID
ncbi:pyroglutamyl-peptidase I [Oenococcus sp. UCMA 17063]|nr:pyroglutamyl-peptidase I [Oenococcus sp. UCMA 17063]